jgi:hypothetical protein
VWILFRKPSFAEHLLNNGHSVGTTDVTMKLIPISNNGPYVIMLEGFCIFSETKKRTQTTVIQSVKIEFFMSLLSLQILH